MTVAGEERRSACRMCHGGCGVLVRLEEGKVVGVRGDPDSPKNRGLLCPKGLRGLETLTSPHRLTHPLRRAGPRGSGRFERATWDEALSDIAARLNQLRESDGPECIAVGTGTARHHFDHVVRFAHALGTPNWFEPGTAQCLMPRVNVCTLTLGGYPVADHRGEVDPAVILVWGHNPLVSHPDGELGFELRSSLKSRPALVVVDPRRTTLAERADLWLQLRPGSDDALALALLHVLVEEDLVDRAFVERWTVGYPELVEHLRPFTPEWAAPVTWVDADRIRAAARLFASRRPGTLEWGCAIEQTPNAVQTVRAVSLLPVLTGNLDVPGGWVFGADALGRFPYLFEALPLRQHRKRLGADRFPLLGGRGSVLPSAHAPTVFQAMLTGEPYRVKAFLVFGNNTLVSYADSRKVDAALRSLDFLVVTDLYRTPTAELADWILPAASWLEIDAVLAVPFFAQNVVLANQKLASVGEARPDEEILIELARRMGLEHGTTPLREVLDGQLEPLGVTFDELRERGHVQLPTPYRRHEREGRFRTRSGKVELRSATLERLGQSPLPTWDEPPQSPLRTPELAERFPLVLTTGARSPFFFNTEFRQLPGLRAGHRDPRVEIHPETAAAHGIAEGDWVWIEGPNGRVRQRARLTGTIDRRVVNADHGWWFPEREDPDHGVFDSNINVLTSSEGPFDPGMGTCGLRALLCRISRAEPPEAARP